MSRKKKTHLTGSSIPSDRMPANTRTAEHRIFSRQQLADTLKLPKDMLFGASILTMTGNQELWVENYKGIIEYTPESIILQAKTGRICICGCHLTIDYYTNEDMKIIGTIQSVSYL